MDLRSPRPSSTTIRRNPPRRAKQTPVTTTASTSSSATAAAVAGITPFPLNEILEVDPPPPTPQSPSPSDLITESPSLPLPPPTPRAAAAAENLKVFLRIRPLEIRSKAAKQPVARARGNGAAPAKGAKNKSGVCLSVNDSSSVTLSAPNSLLDPKRSKSEVYNGFAHVFPPDSQQKEIYERVMDPLVLDFMGGKSVLLAAMGPTGSGKTHTMFGCPREPGMVPLALQKIFSYATDYGVPQPSRLYYLSILEIYSERGKGERIIDLLPDASDLSLKQSTLKDLQVVMISNVQEAESLIARGMLKRTTAATNANTQSSRSQCIINIHSAQKSIRDGNTANTAVLTIADLAGAEREKKTGNQGARLLESNFINNTSMVFGLCLRSLLEHQKNPKKPFQKHFKNSLLTRYLKEYMEGKKRMTLILTVKPGEDDYQDTSFLLRQASPYMKIKFNNAEDILTCQKRSTSISIRAEHIKRRKYNNSEDTMVDVGKGDKGAVAGHKISETENNSEKQQEPEAIESINASSDSLEAVQMGTQLIEERYDVMPKMTRNYEVMQNFAKALWNVLKQYKQKLEASENEAQSLNETVAKQTTQIMELENELKELKSRCSCHEQSMKLKDQYIGFLENKCGRGGLQELDDPGVSEIISTGRATDSAHLESSVSSLQSPIMARDAENSSSGHGTLLEEKKTCVSQVEICDSMDTILPVQDSTRQNRQLQLPQNSQEVEHKHGFSEELKYVAVKLPKDASLTMEDDKDIEPVPKNVAPPFGEVIKQPELHASFDEDVRYSGKSQMREPLKKENHKPSSKPSNVEKPRRRLLPASAMLVNGFSGLDMEVENPKDIKGKRTSEGRERSQGSISLVQLIKNSLHH